VYEYTVSSKVDGIVKEIHGYAKTMVEAICIAESAGDEMDVQIKQVRKDE
jgi:hypothetical protein